MVNEPKPMIPGLTVGDYNALTEKLRDANKILSAVAGASSEGGPDHFNQLMGTAILSVAYLFEEFNSESHLIPDQDRIKTLGTSASRLRALLPEARRSLAAFNDFNATQRDLAVQTFDAVEQFSERLHKAAITLRLDGLVTPELLTTYKTSRNALSDFDTRSGVLGELDSQHPSMLYAHYVMNAVTGITASVELYREDRRSVPETVSRFTEIADSLRGPVAGMREYLREPDWQQYGDEQQQVNVALEQITAFQQRLREAAQALNKTAEIART